MNQRIQELALQVYGTQVTAQEIKFADMIVRECAKVADNHMSGPGCVIRDNIKEHFGVEE